MDIKIRKLLGKTNSASLATCEENNPRVRPMTLIFKDDRFFFATGRTDAKAGQIAKNPKAEFIHLICEGENTGYLRGSGTLQSITELSLRKEVSDWAPFIYSYFKDPSDPELMLYELKLERLSLMLPGEMCETQVSL